MTATPAMVTTQQEKPDMGFLSAIAGGIGEIVKGGIAEKVLKEVARPFKSESGQSTAVDIAPTTIQAIETPTSGTITAGVPSFLPAVPGLISKVPKVVRDIGVGTGVGVGVGQLFDMGGNVLGVRVNDKGTLVGLTRKEQRQAKQLVELVGYSQAADILGLSEQMLGLVLTKKFRAGGKGITASQLRTAQRVNNRIVHMHKQLESSFKRSTTTARRRTAGTRVTQIKN